MKKNNGKCMEQAKEKEINKYKSETWKIEVINGN